MDRGVPQSRRRPRTGTVLAAPAQRTQGRSPNTSSASSPSIRPVELDHSVTPRSGPESPKMDDPSLGASSSPPSNDVRRPTARRVPALLQVPGDANDTTDPVDNL